MLFSEESQRLQDAIGTLKQELNKKREIYNSSKWSLKSKQDELEKKKSKIVDLEKNENLQRRALNVLNDISAVYEQFSIRKKIEVVLSEIMKGLFEDDNLNFTFFRKINRNQQEIYIYKIENREGQDYLIPIQNTAGGLKDVVDLIMRVLILQRCPKNQRILFLDEPLKNLSRDLRTRFFLFFKNLCEQFNIQIIMISHEPEYIDEIEQIHQFYIEDGKTKVKSESRTDS
jgi:ABC-type lipoprotein export system ATPase subunit